jgi:enterochelin esterase-like enzyme
MNSKPQLFFILFLWAQLTMSQSVVRTDLKINSKVLNREMAYSIFLPEGYGTSHRQYPVLYLLHGFTGDHTDWIQYGEVQKIADNAILKESVTPMLIVMPSADSTWYINTFDGSANYEEYFITEFIPMIEKSYPIRAEKQFRAVAGLSMGGHGALLYGIRYPELFSAVGSLSASVRNDEELIQLSDQQWRRLFVQAYGDYQGKKRITSHLKENTVLNVIKTKNATDLSTVDYYIDCGDDDHLIVCNMKLHEVFLAKKVKHEFRVRDGAHSWSYWRSGLPDILKYVSDRFHR